MIEVLIISKHQTLLMDFVIFFQIAVYSFSNLLSASVLVGRNCYL